MFTQKLCDSINYDIIVFPQITYLYIIKQNIVNNDCKFIIIYEII